MAADAKLRKPYHS